MPELPEVETVVKQLDKVLAGREIDEVEVLREKSAQSDLNQVKGMVISRVVRKQKMIVMELAKSDKGQGTSDKDLDTRLVVHLKMTGQLVWREAKPKFEVQSSNVKMNESAKADDFKSVKQVQGGHPTSDWVDELPSKHTRIIVTFKDGSKLFFNDQRVFGWIKVMDDEDFKDKLSKMPPDVVDDEFTAEYLGDCLSRSGRAVKLVILDQQKMGGMGNIYACDSLWLAKIRPAKVAKKVRKKEVGELHAAMVKTLNRAIELGGSSYSDFVDTSGLGGGYQNEFLTYDQEGEKCQREECEGVIEKIKIGARGTYFCPECQK